ncbi:MAG: 3-phosphoshikimate 1-carboxyvinyltransferase [Parvularculales bacterium]
MSVAPTPSAMVPLISEPVSRLAGRIQVPGDKSISHRALILGALAVGRTSIEGLSEGADVMATAQVLQALGAKLEHEAGQWMLSGVGIGGLRAPDQPLDFGNSGTGVRLMMGVLATHPFTSVLTGDPSLSARPMDRVMSPLQSFGAQFEAREPCLLPVIVRGAASAIPISHVLTVASAQVKSALLLAGLNAPGVTTIEEPVLTRDHTERLLNYFGAQLSITNRDEGGVVIRLEGQPELHPASLSVPGDPSAAAFPMVAALIVPEASIVIENIMLNAGRNGLIEVLQEMGAHIRMVNKRQESGEDVADIEVASGPLQGVHVAASRVPSMIDEYPAFMVAAAYAQGDTVMEGLGELRVKETDRLTAMTALLEANGVLHTLKGDNLTVHGQGVPPQGGGVVATHMDHRIAMAALTLGVGAKQPVAVEDTRMIATSFPNYVAVMTALGARFKTP